MQAVAPQDRCSLWLSRVETYWLLASALLLWVAQRPWAAWPPLLEAGIPAVLILVAPAPLLAAFARGGGAGLGALFGLLWWGLGGLWLVHCHPVFGVLAWLGMVAIAAALTWPLGFALGRLRHRLGPDQMLWWAPVVWCAWEMAHSSGPFGCPWLQLSHSFWKVLPLLQVAELAGPYALTLAAATVSAGLARRLVGLPGAGRQALLGLALLALFAAYGAVRLRQLEPRAGAAHQVALVQANVPLDEKAGGDIFDLFDRHDQLTWQVPAGTELVVWPETAVPHRLWAIPTMRLQLQAAARQLRTTLLVGGVLPVPAFDLHTPVVLNSAFVIGPDGRLVATYSKKHLVILGEYLPGRELWPIRLLARHTPQYYAGDRYRAVDTPVGRLGVPICYESAFPADCRAMVRDGAQALCVITNDDQLTEVGARQLFQQAVFRSVETRRWLVRCANSGISAVVDPTGRVVTSSAWDRRTVHPGTFHLRADVTLYTRYGDWLPWLCLLATGGALLLKQRPRKD